MPNFVLIAKTIIFLSKQGNIRNSDFQRNAHMPDDYIQSLQANLSPKQRLDQIVEHAMCIGCGICQSAIGIDRIKLEIVESGNFRPIGSDALTDTDMDQVVSICPGTRARGLPASLIDSHSQVDPVWGVWREIYLAWSAEPDIRHLAATGGLLTGLGLYMIESSEVDFLVHATQPEAHPTFGERWISRTRKDVIRGSGSRYGPTATLIDIQQIINNADQRNETYAFIGTPCDVTALRNYAEQDGRVDRICQYMLTMVCGGFMAANGARTALSNVGVDYDQVSSIRYRGYGCPGPTTITTTDNKLVDMNYLHFWGEDESTWGLPPRCKVCPDGIGDAADIAASDTWDGGSPTWQGQDDDPGFNAAVIRTKRGQGLMERAMNAGYINRGAKLNPTDMNRFQPHQESKKRSVWARFQGLKQRNQIFPQTEGLRLEELCQKNTDEQNQVEMNGTAARVDQGEFMEPPPTAVGNL